MKLAWLLANSLASAWYSYSLSYSRMFSTIGRKWGYAAADKATLVLLGALFIVHGVLAAAIAFAASVDAAITITSVLTFAWAESAYVLLQRFAGPFDRPMLVSQLPAFYPLSAFVSFALSVTAFVLFVGWPLAFVPLVVYLSCGFLSTEIAIRRVVRRFNEAGHGKDRRLAISVINGEQRRGGYSYAGGDRYPFILYGSTNRAYTVLGWYYHWYYRIRNSQQSSRRISKSTEPDILDSKESSRPIERGQELTEDSPEKSDEFDIFTCEARKRVDAAEEAEDWVEMLKASQTLVRQFPDHPLAWFCLGTAYVQQDKNNDAVAALREAIKLAQDYTEAWSILGMAYGKQGEYEEAITACRQATKLKPDSPVGWQALGQIYSLQGKHDDAIAACREEIKLTPDDPMAWRVLGYHYRMQGKYDEALTAYREAVKLKPGDAEVLFDLGRPYMLQRKHDEAVAVYRQVVELRPDFQVAWYNLGVSYGHQRKYDEAIAALRQAIKLKPDDSDACYSLGLDFAIQGKRAEALDALDHLRKLNASLADKLADFLSSSHVPPTQSSPPQKREPEPIKEGRHEGKRILITDDIEAVRESIRLILKDRGYELVILESKIEALEKLREIKPDLVTTDLNAPLLNGFEFIQRIKGIDPSIPVIVISGHLTPENARKAIQLGAFDCLHKPLDVYELRQVVERALQTRRSSSEAHQ